MTKGLIRFALLLAIVLSTTFGIQSFVQHTLQIGSFERYIILNYCFNFIFTLVSFAVLLYFKKKNSNQLGFIFMFSSMTKFVLFFVMIYPTINHSHGVKSAEFASFFIPYTICSVLEIIHLTRRFKSSN